MFKFNMVTKKLKERIQKINFFNEVFYLENYEDVKKFNGTAEEHFYKIGYKENRKPNEVFDPIWYKEHYGDVNEDGVNPISHYIFFGREENRFVNEKEWSEYKVIKESNLFDDSFYLNEYDDINKSGVDPLIHYCQIGYQENRKPNEEFDPIWYKEYYSDVNEDGVVPLIHYILFGKDENRFINEKEKNEFNVIKESNLFNEKYYYDEYLKIQNLTINPLLDYCRRGYKNNFNPNSSFDSEWYMEYYIDIKASKINPLVHYILYGENENRFINFKSFLKFKGIKIEFIENYIDKDFFKQIKNINKINISYIDLVERLTGVSSKVIKVSNDSHINSRFYLELGESFLLNSKVVEANKSFFASLLFNQNSRTLELLGNINFDLKNYNYAIPFYIKAIKINKSLKFCYLNLSHSFMEVNKFKEAIETLLEGIKENPLFLQNYINKIDDYLAKLYNMEKLYFINKFIGDKNRSLLVEDFNSLSRYIYSIYYKIYNGNHKVLEYNTVNRKKILIIGDYHVEQCVRYRIEQKVEQLKYQKVDVDTIDWLELEKYKDSVPFYDIVIFYRVPFTLSIIQVIAQVNALNKVSLYEIDDLLFESIYPDDIDTYGGSIGLETYQSLIIGMAEFNSVIQLCTYGIASTIPIKNSLDKLLTKHSIIHRNGFDKFNTLVSDVDIKEKYQKKETIDILYGSATLAHNKDFNDLVVPGITKIMEQYTNVRLIILGHLIFEESFLEKYKEKIIQLPKVSIITYYNYLKIVDINLAVLHRDKITDAKSELKWFEAGLYSIPSIVSGTQNYLDIVKDGEDGLIANSPEEWYRYLHQLVIDKELRKTIGINVANRIKDEYSVKELGLKLNKNLNSLIDTNYRKRDKKRKKIALVNVFFPPESIGGATRVVSDNFDVLIDSYSDEYEICVFTSEVECLEPYKVSMYNYKGVRVYRLNILYRENMDWYAEDKNMYELFQKFLEVETPDKVHFHCVQRLTASVVEATKDMDIPYLITVHDAWWISDHQFLVDKNEKVYPNGHIDPFYTRVLPDNVTLNMSIERESFLKSLLKSAQHVLTVSESFAKIYRKNGIPNISVTKNGISSKIEWLQKETSYSSKVVCGHIGGMSAHKGYDILKKAVISTQPKNLEFLVVDHSKEESYISNKKWGEVDVKFIGRQKQDEMVEVYTKIDILFAPSIWPESFGLVTREASACGCWIVAGNLGGIGEDVIDGRNGFVIEPNKEAIIKTLKKIDTKYKKYKGIAPKGHVSIVEEQVEKLKEFLDD